MGAHRRQMQHACSDSAHGMSNHLACLRCVLPWKICSSHPGCRTSRNGQPGPGRQERRASHDSASRDSAHSLLQPVPSRHEGCGHTLGAALLSGRGNTQHSGMCARLLTCVVSRALTSLLSLCFRMAKQARRQAMVRHPLERDRALRAHVHPCTNEPPAAGPPMRPRDHMSDGWFKPLCASTSFDCGCAAVTSDCLVLPTAWDPPAT